MGTRSYEELVARTWRENRLFDLLLELTYRCNLDCFYCYNDTSRTGEPLSLERYREILAEASELGVFHLTLSGGEPLAHPGFFAIGGRARELGFVIRIKSNGHALRGRIARRLRDEVDPFVVDVSLHGAVPATHDRQTRVPGSFERLMGNLREMRELGLRLKLNCTLTAWNEGEAEAMADLALDLGIPLAFNSVVSPRDDGSTEPLRIAATREGLIDLWKLLETRAGSLESRPREGDEMAPALGAEKNCGAGSSSLTVDPYGDVLPCVQWRRPVGNLHRQSLREIWDDRAGALARVREITVAAVGAKRELEAKGGARVDFCPGMAELVAGDPLASDPDLERRQGILREHEAAKPRPLLPVIS